MLVSLFGGIVHKNSVSSGHRNGTWMRRHAKPALLCAVGVMSLTAFVWLGYEFWRLFFDPKLLFGRKVVTGGIDLKILHDFVHGWFSGAPIYHDNSGRIFPARLATYPPASFAITWPLLGWLGFSGARILWMAVTLLSLAFLVRTFARESGSQTPLERVFAGLIPLAAYPCGAAIGNGQFTIVVVACLMASLLLLARGEARWKTDIAASCLFLFALVKPHISAPFFWMALFIPCRMRPALLISGGYCALTIFASFWQEAGPVSLLADWLSRATNAAGVAGYVNLHMLLAVFGLERFGLHVSLLLLSGLGVITYFCRCSDFWLLLGITSITARLWTYHQWYDDLLILLSLLVLLRIAHSYTSSTVTARTAGILFRANLVLMLVPGGQFLVPPPGDNLYLAALAFSWLASLGFLLHTAWKERGITAIGKDTGKELPDSLPT